MSDDDLMGKILGEIAAPKVVMPPPPEPSVVPPPPLVIPASELRRMMPPIEDIIDPDGDVGLPQIEHVRQGQTQFVDEVDAYMKNKYRAAKQTPDEFYQRVIEQQQAREALAEDVPFTRSNPKSAAKAVFGNNELVQSGAMATKELCRWTVEDIDATNVTVALALIGQPPPGNGPNIIRPYGIIKVGTNGNLSTFEVDIGMGCQFTVGGSFVSVTVGMDDDGGANAGSAVLAANLSFSNVNHSTAMTRTKYTPASGAAVTVQVPAFAKTVLFMTNDPAQTYTLTFKDWAGNTLYSS